jgi:hypothetical protein
MAGVIVVEEAAMPAPAPEMEPAPEPLPEPEPLPMEEPLPVEGEPAM